MAKKKNNSKETEKIIVPGSVYLKENSDILGQLSKDNEWIWIFLIYCTYSYRSIFFQVILLQSYNKNSRDRWRGEEIVRER